MSRASAMTCEPPRRRALRALSAAALVAARPSFAAVPPDHFRVIVRKWKMNDAPSVGEGITSPLADLGYVVGKNLALVEDDLPGPKDSAEVLAKRLAAIRSAPVHAVVDVSPLARWWQSMLPGVPIVAWGTTDPVAEGIAESFTRPGTNITGTTQGHPEVARKQVDILRKIVPDLSGIAIFGYGRSGEIRTPVLRFEQECYETAIRDTGLKMRVFAPDECRSPTSALPFLRNQRLQAAIYITVVGKDQILNHAPVAIEHRIATIGYWWHMSANGLLASYGELREEWFKRIAQQLDRLFRGNNASEMPFINPSRYHFRLNLRTATAIGLRVTPELRILADNLVT